MPGSDGPGYSGRMLRTAALVALCASIALTTLTGPAPAALALDQDRARSAVESGQALPLGAVLRSIRQQYDGRLLDADLRRGSDGRWVYVLRILRRDGRVVGIIADGRTGNILGVR